jgi:hypothetical protein
MMIAFQTHNSKGEKEVVQKIKLKHWKWHTVEKSQTGTLAVTCMHIFFACLNPPL